MPDIEMQAIEINKIIYHQSTLNSDLEEHNNTCWQNWSSEICSLLFVICLFFIISWMYE